ncbi:MAG: response regulator [Deltaproteobacteria bacterium]|nr:response regulator [Deltaproteobacteria bacterium]
MSARVLVVDDEPNVVETISAVLRRKGHRVSNAADGAEALAQVQAERFDLVLMDVRMPGMDGVSALQQMRALPDPPRVVLMTAWSAPHLLEQACQAGAVDVIPKPLDLPRLLGLIEDQGHRRTILVVDDDRAFLRSLSRALEAQQLAVHTATTAEEALTQLTSARVRPDVVLLDLRLPGMSGADALVAIKKLDLGIAVVLVSAYEIAMDHKLRGDAVAVLQKPFEMDRLLRTIDEVTSARGA